MITKILDKLSIERYQIYLDTGYYESGKYSKTWDMLTWIDYQKEKSELQNG